MKHRPSLAVPSRPRLARAVLGLALFPLTGAAVQDAAPPASAAEVVAAARRALGWDELAASKGALRVVGDARVLGTDAKQTILFDGAGRFLETFDGPLAQSDGTDGRTAWSRDWTDTPRVLVLGDLAEAQVGTLLVTGGWTVSEDLLDFELAPPEDGEIALAFTHADGVLSGTLRLDAASHRARSATLGSGETEATWTFSGYTDHAGFVFPHEIESTTHGMTQGLDVQAVERLDRADDGAFAPRLDPPSGSRFDPGVAPELEVRRAATGHLLVQGLVNGEDLGWFIFDSGAGVNCISTEVTDDRFEGPFGEIGARGVGGTVPAHFWRADELRVGPLAVDRPIFMGLDLAFLEPYFGVPVAGIVGFEFLSRCVAELDVVEPTISLFDPASYALPAGRWEEVLLYSRLPCVRASFEDREGLFKIDTGAADDTVTLHYQVVHDLALTEGRETSPSMNGGVGGMVGTRTGKLETFRLGGHEFGAISAGFALEDKGAFSDDYVWGNIGGKLLEPFRLVFDYPHGRLGFVPRETR